MAKRRCVSDRSIEKLNRWKKDINHIGYRPFLTVRDVNKIGRRHWIFCPHQDREVELLSDGESYSYIGLLWIEGRISVFEQYALDIDETLDIAVEMGVVHPGNYKTNEAYIMTTDFVLKLRSDGRIKSVAYTFKYNNQIYKVDTDGVKRRINPRTWEKFEIERRYWAARGIEYRVVTELDFTKEQAWNLRFCESSANLAVEPVMLANFVSAFYRHWQSKCNRSLNELCDLTALSCNISASLSMAYFKYAVLYGVIKLAPSFCVREFRRIDICGSLQNNLEVR